MSRLESGDRRLATALIELAKEEDKVTEYLEALKSIQTDFKKEPQLPLVLSSHQIPTSELIELVDKLYGDVELKHLVPFLKLLVTKRYIVRFNEVVNQYIFQADEILGIEEGIVYSVKLLTDEELKCLEDLFSEKLGKKVHLINRTEPSLLGGIRVFVNGKAYDGSLSSKLESLREKLLKADSNGGSSL